MTTINANKIRENVTYLGLNPVKIDSTEKRSAVRKLLNGLGFATADYIELTMPQLQAIYNDMLKGLSFDTWGIKGCSGETRTAAVEAFKTHGNYLMQPQSDDDMSTAVIDNNLYMEPPVKKRAEPVKGPVKEMTISESQALATLRALVGKQDLDTDAVQAMIDKAMSGLKAPLPTEIKIIKDGKSVVMPIGLHHTLLPNLIKALSTGCNIMLVGPAGSGKTTLAHQASDALGVNFYFNGAISSEYKLTGFVDAQGRIVSTAFRKAYETGGLYLFDEIDASMPDALLAFNAALANGHMDFPDGTVKRHEQFYCVAAANTFGKGADRVYVGRNQLDAASLDRFIVLNVDYDEKLERALAGNDNWTDKVQGIRKAVYEHKIRHVISPRASINGARMLAAGFKESEVMESVVWKGLDADSVKKIKAAC